VNLVAREWQDNDVPARINVRASSWWAAWCKCATLSLVTNQTFLSTFLWSLDRTVCVSWNPKIPGRILLGGKVLPSICPCWRQLVHSDYREDARVILSSVTYAFSELFNQRDLTVLNSYMNMSSSDVRLCTVVNSLQCKSRRILSDAAYWRSITHSFILFRVVFLWAMVTRLSFRLPGN